MVYKAVIFDLDGTLLDTLEDLAFSMNRVLSAYGFKPYPVDDYRYFVGNGMEELVRAVVPGRSNDLDFVRKMVNAMRSAYSENWHRCTKPYTGIRELLKVLEDYSLHLCVLSNKPDDFTKIITQYYFPSTIWSGILGQRPGLPRKPDPAGALEIASCLSLEPQQILYIGDTDTDMKTATAAGMFPVGVLWGFRPEQELIENGAKGILLSPMDLLKYIR